MIRTRAPAPRRRRPPAEKFSGAISEQDFNLVGRVAIEFHCGVGDVPADDSGSIHE